MAGEMQRLEVMARRANQRTADLKWVLAELEDERDRARVMENELASMELRLDDVMKERDALRAELEIAKCNHAYAIQDAIDAKSRLSAAEAELARYKNDNLRFDTDTMERFKADFQKVQKLLDEFILVDGGRRKEANK